jgi:glycerol-3-phosphate responsive antiterminator
LRDKGLREIPESPNNKVSSVPGCVPALCPRVRSVIRITGMSGGAASDESDMVIRITAAVIRITALDTTPGTASGHEAGQCAGLCT